jgi:cytochrome P450
MATDETPAQRWPFPRECPGAVPEKYAELRGQCPVSRVELWDGSSAWLLTRYADIRSILRDTRFSADSSVPGFPAPNAAIAAARRVQRGFVRLDGTDHSRQRNLLTRYFALNHVQSMRPFVEQKVAELLDNMAAAGSPADLVEHLAEPLPILITCSLLGLPLEDADTLLDHVTVWMSSDSPPEKSTKAANDIVDYFRRVIAREKASPTTGMVSDLVHKHVAKGDISEDELLWILHLLLVGGFDTAANMISLGTLTLFKHREEASKLAGDMPRVTRVVEELLRLHSVAHYTASRMAREEVTIGEQSIEAGQGVVAPLPAANFDPDVFPDPAKFDPDRQARAHLAFGFGVHQCLGQGVARLELSVVFSQLFARFPNLRLAVPEEDLEYNNSMIYGLKRLPVSW